MERLTREAMNCITYIYTDTKLSKEEMLGYIIDHDSNSAAWEI